MGKLSTLPTLAPAGLTRTVAPAVTHEGGQAYARDSRSDLFLLAVTNMVGEDTFYETAQDRDSRFRQLVHDVTATDPGWVARFVPFLRGSMNMRSASIVMAAEYALAARALGEARPADAPTVRSVIASALQRPDEPGELLGYWRSRAGRVVPSAVKRGVADAALRLYTERSAIKWDGQGQAWRFADVLDVTHPKPAAPWQSGLFTWLLDRRHGHEKPASPEVLPTVAAYQQLRALPTAGQRAAVLTDPELLDRAGLTWEHLAGLGPMDQQAWEAMIPRMGYMALLRNLRNFDEAGVGGPVALAVATRLADPEQVARSKQFPYRFLSAYRAAPNLRWAYPLEVALGHSVRNVPPLPGRTLVLVDTSASMRNAVSARSTISHVDVAALFGIALARAGNEVDLIGFADGAFRYDLAPGGSALRDVEGFTQQVGIVGYGTRIAEAVHATYNGHDRVVIISDMQTHPGMNTSRSVPPHIPVFGVNTSGYAASALDTSSGTRRYEIGGFSDRLFTVVAQLSAGRDATWPF